MSVFSFGLLLRVGSFTSQKLKLHIVTSKTKQTVYCPNNFTQCRGRIRFFGKLYIFTKNNLNTQKSGLFIQVRYLAKMNLFRNVIATMRSYKFPTHLTIPGIFVLQLICSNKIRFNCNIYCLNVNCIQ